MGLAHGFLQNIHPILWNSWGEQQCRTHGSEVSHHAQKFSFAFRFRKAFEIRQIEIGKARVFPVPWIFDARVKMHGLVFHEVVLKDRSHRRDLGIDLAACEGDIEVFVFVSRNDPRIFEIEKIGDHAAVQVPGMPHRSAADAQTAGGAQLCQVVVTQRCARDEDIIELVLGRAEIDELVDIVLHAGFSEHGVRDDAAGNAEQSKTVGAGAVVEMIGRFPTSRAGHVLKRDGRIAGDVLGQHRR